MQWIPRLAFVLLLFAVLPVASAGPPWACPIWPIVDDYFYADRYEESCEESPTGAYLVGDFDWPEPCGEGCQDATLPGKSFAGLPEKAPYEYEHKFPDGPASKYATRVGRRKFITFKAGPRDIVAQVHEFVVDAGLATGQQSRRRAIHLGFETSAPQNVKLIPVTGKPLDGDDGHAFVVDFKLGSILVLTAKESSSVPSPLRKDRAKQDDGSLAGSLLRGLVAPGSQVYGLINTGAIPTLTAKQHVLLTYPQPCQSCSD